MSKDDKLARVFTLCGRPYLEAVTELRRDRRGDHAPTPAPCFEYTYYIVNS
jgi:hypothetical protein